MRRRVVAGLSCLFAFSVLAWGFQDPAVVPAKTGSSAVSGASTVNVWMTDPATGTWLVKQPNLTFTPLVRDVSALPTVVVASQTVDQEMTGFGAALTDSSAWLIAHDLTASGQASLLRTLFNRQSGIGLDMIRLPMGASDFAVHGNYSYDDMPPGKTDPSLQHFSIAHDEAYIIPELRSILRLQPHMTVVATPWSPPAWMKDTDSMNGGSLLPQFEPALAEYFVKFLEAYRAQGVPVKYVTVQNEPLNDTSTYPGMLMPVTQETQFIADDLGPALKRAGLPTQILGYDHNWDTPSYPEAILQNPVAYKDVAGTAWHWYAGDPSAMTVVHDEFPAKSTFVTEASGGAWQGGTQNAFADDMQQLIIGSTRNYAQGIILWNLALDPQDGPTNNGCTDCRGVVTIQPSTHTFTKTVDFYALAQASDFVRYGAHRVASSSAGVGQLQDVAFVNPSGQTVLIAYNGGPATQPFRVVWGDRQFTTSLAAGAAATFTWDGTMEQGGPFIGAESVGPLTSGGTMTLYGSGFGRRMPSSKVLVSGRAAAVLSWDSGEIVFRAPSATSVGKATVVVDAAGPQSNVVTIPVIRQLPSLNWIATASSNDNGDVPSNAVDGPPGSRFSTGQAQAPGEWYEVDMVSAQTFNQIVLDSGASTGDYARGYQVFVSDNGRKWGRPIAQGVGLGSPETIDFATQHARFIKVVETGSSGNWWSIARFEVNLV